MFVGGCVRSTGRGDDRLVARGRRGGFGLVGS